MVMADQVAAVAKVFLHSVAALSDLINRIVHRTTGKKSTLAKQVTSDFETLSEGLRRNLANHPVSA
jgi:hypothetical protein